MTLLVRILASPLAYAGWLAAVCAVLVAGYFIDPYVFGIGALALVALSVPVGLVGLGACVLVRGMRPRTRAAIVALLVLTAVALAAALGILRTFKWN